MISLDIHDGLIQEMFAAKMMVEAALTEFNSVGETVTAGVPNAGIQEKLETAEQQLRRAIEEARRLMNRLQPIAIHEHGLVVSIEHLLMQLRNESDLEIEFNVGVDLQKLPAMLESNLYRIVQEALNNVRKHARAKSVIVNIDNRDGELWLSVLDDGNGFDQAEVRPNNVGLRGIRQRAQLSGGRVEISSDPKTGTAVTVVVPISK